MKVRFKDLKLGDRFVFSSENDPAMRSSGMQRGPWIKTGPRRYRHLDIQNHPSLDNVKIGTINVEVQEEATA